MCFDSVCISLIRTENIRDLSLPLRIDENIFLLDGASL